ncbi:CHAT domain-containing protein [Flammula alnicola]|nr:CHAT domain-containing protein [Flammula alnicola]
MPHSPSNQNPNSIFHPYGRPASHISEAQASGGENSDIDSASQENYDEPRVTNGSATECATEVDENSFVKDDQIEGHEDDENIDIAISLIAECKAQLSLPNLNNVVFLFRQLLDDHPTTRPFHTDAMRGLASALGVRFMYTNQINDLEESLILRGQIMESLISVQGTSGSSFVFCDWDSVDAHGLMQMTKGFLADFQKSPDLDTINSIVHLLQRSLARHPNPHPRRFAALTTLADGLYARFHHCDTMADLNNAISCLEDAAKCCTERDWQQLNTLCRICCMLGARFDSMRDMLDLKRAFASFIDANPQETEASEGALAQVEFANKLQDEFGKSGNMDDLNTAVALYREGITELPASSHNYVVTLNNLANAVATRFEQGGQRSDLDEAISLHRQALELRPSPHPDRSASLNNLASALKTQFEQGGQRSDLDEAISLYRQALELPPPHPLQSASFDNLASALWTRFEQGGQRSDLDEAISLHRQALKLRPSPHRSGSLSNLANALLTRFQQGGQRSDLDEAVSLYRQALELRPSPHPDRSASLNNLASALKTRFEQGGQRGDLDEAISLYRQALELLPSPHPLRSASLNNLANALETRFEHGGQRRDDVDEAISLYRQALELRPSPHPRRYGSLSNLANALKTRFEQGGQRSDLDEAISLHRQALELRPSPHPLRSSVLNNLASALWTRFEQGGQRSDVDEAISLYRQALELRPSSHPLRSGILNNLASALWTRFEQGGQRRDLDEAISLHRQALKLLPSPHPDRSASLNNLANALKTRFEQGGQRNDLDEAIPLHRQALELRPSPHPDRSASLNNLASALKTQFEQGGERSDLDEVISLHRQALELRPSPHPDRSTSFAALGDILVDAHSLTDRNSDFLEQAMCSFSAATQCLSQPPSRRLNIAKSWIRHADNHQHIHAIDAYDAALQALPQLAALSFSLQSRQEALSAGSDGLARDASRCAIRAGDLVKAVEFLEAGRSIFWSQSLSLRSPFDQLRDIEPQLADKLRHIADALELGSHRDISADISDNRRKLSRDQEASRLNRLNEEWANGIDEVRKLKGFEDFLRPRRFSELQRAASEYPVVILVANNDGSHCLILTSTTIQHIDLPRLPTRRLQDLVRLVQVAVSESTVSFSSVERVMEDLAVLLGENRAVERMVHKLGSSDDVFKRVLRILWNEVVKPVVDFLKIEKSCSGELPMLQWCPTGPFTFLPIHAAGCYDIELSGECASDYFVSSYIPTIGALLTHDPAPSTETFKMTVVIQSTELPSTKTELKNIEKHVSSGMLNKLGVPGKPATIEAVASCLSNASIVHFACHGKQDRLRPLDSGLKLDDGLLRVSRIMQETMPNGSLAFLCACETGKGDENLPDEAMSLGASLLFSGFRRVIATMWEMRDADGPTIADTFYEELFRGPDGKPALEPDITKSARALYLAVNKLRSQNVSFRRWVPFIHMGK